MTRHSAPLVAGVDIGSVTSKAVILDGRRVIGEAVIPTGASASVAGQTVLDIALRAAQVGQGQLVGIVSTGYGRAAAGFARRQVTEITCHARGTHHLAPEARTIIDIGGQDSKVIRVDQNGTSIDFLMNDKCAAGTGRFLEVIARALQIDIKDMAPVSARSSRPAVISSMCTVFAESEVVALVASNEPLENIVAGIHLAIADRVATMAYRLGIELAIVMTGGVALNTGVVRALEQKLNHRIRVAPQPQLVGALGAALIAADLYAERQT